MDMIPEARIAYPVNGTAKQGSELTVQKEDEGNGG
jgi:hypothetical protein